MHRFEFAAILFDLDGVLVDSIANVEKHWHEFARQQNLNSKEVIDFAHGRPSIDTIRLLAPHLDAEAEAKKIDQAKPTIQKASSKLRRTTPGIINSGRSLGNCHLRYRHISFQSFEKMLVCPSQNFCAIR